LSPLLTVKLTCASPPCRHVTSVLIVLYNTDTCAIHLSILNCVLTPLCMLTHRHPHSVTHVVTHTPQFT